MAPAILDANEQYRFIAYLTRAGVEHGVGRVGPILGREGGIGGMALEQFRMSIGCIRFSKHSDFLFGYRPSTTWTMAASRCEFVQGYALATGDLRLSPTAFWISKLWTSAHK